MGNKKTPTPTMQLTRVRSTATTYEMRVPEPLGGWAICTVNDRTGELLITSDWGNWSHQWSSNPKHLGAADLTAFIGDRQAVDYLASKLNVGSGPRYGTEFDADETSRVFCGIVAKWRLECGHEAIELARDNEETLEQAEHRLDGGPSQWPGLRDTDLRDNVRRWFTKDSARRLCDDIRSLAGDVGYGAGSDQLYLERFYKLVERHDAMALFPDAYEDLVFSQTSADRVLRESILPVLIEACREVTFGRLLVAANGPQPALEAA